MAGLLVALVMLLVSYPPLELSRLIWLYGIDGELVFELVIIWVAYGVALWLVVRFFDYHG